MKTAEEWAKAYENRFNQLDKEADDKIGEGVVSFVDIHEIIIREIQLDAMKEGMRRAAGIGGDALDNYGREWQRPEISSHRTTVSSAILTAAEQLTERDL